MYLNERPIVVNCFSRAGSGHLLNVFLSHPDVGGVEKEMLEIFSTNLRKSPRIAGFIAVKRAGQPRFFDQWYLHDREPLDDRAQKYIDKVLFRWKMKYRCHREFRFKSPESVYTREELKASRLLIKNNNGLVFLTRRLYELWPDAVFFALVRHPVPLYHSFKRRGIIESAREFARFYKTIGCRMVEEVGAYTSYHLVKFEELIEKPLDLIPELYQKAGLSPEGITKYRFRAKKHYRSDGTYGTHLKWQRHFWFEPDELSQFFEPAVNQLQTQKLDRQEVDELLERTAGIRGLLGYHELDETGGMVVQ